MAKAKKLTFNAARKAILERTAAGRADMDKRAAGADMSDLDHLPVIEVGVAPRTPRVYAQPIVDDRPPMAPPAVVEIEVSLSTRESIRRAAKRSGIEMNEFCDLAVRCILDAAEASALALARTAPAASFDEHLTSVP